MKENFMSVTEAARNFADCVSTVLTIKTSPYVLLKNGTPFARLVPDNARVCCGRDLAEVLAKTELPEETARAWRRDLQAARQSLKPRPPNGDHP
jgi:antitoxin (DNA-binding transcriptional repressor) of toxin-antitoxin stability system